MSDADSARRYYETVDDGAYEALRDLLAPEFVHRRPDRSLVGAEAFVQFMAEERPRTDTTHDVDAVFTTDDAPEVAVAGRLRDAAGEELFAFVDVFRFEDGRMVELRTFTR